MEAPGRSESYDEDITRVKSHGESSPMSHLRVSYIVNIHFLQSRALLNFVLNTHVSRYKYLIVKLKADVF